MLDCVDEARCVQGGERNACHHSSPEMGLGSVSKGTNNLTPELNMESGVDTTSDARGQGNKLAVKAVTGVLGTCWAAGGGLQHSLGGQGRKLVGPGSRKPGGMHT